MNEFKAILINPDKQDIYKIQIDATIAGIYEKLQCTTFEIPVTWDNLDGLYCDEEAWNFFQKGNKCGFTMAGWNGTIIGKSLILGHTAIGGTADCIMTIEELHSTIIWRDKIWMELYGMMEGYI